MAMSRLPRSVKVKRGMKTKARISVGRLRKGFIVDSVFLLIARYVSNIYI
jgi:hypothetical protein